MPDPLAVARTGVLGLPRLRVCPLACFPSPRKQEVCKDSAARKSSSGADVEMMPGGTAEGSLQAHAASPFIKL